MSTPIVQGSFRWLLRLLWLAIPAILLSHDANGLLKECLRIGEGKELEGEEVGLNGAGTTVSGDGKSACSK